MKILLLDDEPAVLQFIQTALDPVAQTFLATNGKTAIEIIKKEHLDGAVIDLILPDMDGMDILKELYKTNPKAIIAISSAINEKTVISQALRFGAVEYLTKPYSLDYLREIFSKYINKVNLPAFKDIEKPSLLICDDEIDLHIIMKKSISRKIIADIDIAVNGEEAIEKSRLKDYDIIFMDINMPGINGIDAIKKIKEIRPEALIIVISAVCDVSVTTQCIEAGVLDFIHKPTSLDLIQARVNKILMDKNKYIPRYL